MGVVYLGRDPRLNRPVALKVLSGLLAQQPEHLARFEREAKLLASLNHPNIAGIYGVEQTADAQPLLVLEYVPGETLADRIARGPLPVEEALDIARQIAGAVEVAHDGGIIHRDLKPGNVKITPDGQVKVLDFGLAKSGGSPDADLAQSPTFTSVPTAAGVILGTAGYMSPEQARGRAVDKRTDIWSFGCVLYECLTGRRLFDGETISDTIAHILQREPDWSALPAGTSPRVRELLRRCLEKDVRRRQRDIGDVRLELDDALAGRSSAAALPHPGDTGVPRRMSTLWLGVALVLAGAIAGGGVAWSVFGRGRVPADPTVRLSVTFPADLSVRDFQISPDGSRLILRAAPASGTDRRPRLYSRPLDAFEATPLAGTEGVERFTLSPDSRWIAVLMRVNVATGEKRLTKIPIDGSSPPTVLAHWDPKWFDSFIWLEDGDLLASRMETTEQVIFRISSATGAVAAPVKLALPSAGVARTMGRQLRGHGVFVQFDTFGARGYQTNIWLLDPSTGAGTQVLENAAEPVFLDNRYLLFTRDDTLMAAPFDPARGAITGEITALLSGLSSAAGPAEFGLSDNGTLTYVAGAAGVFERTLVVIDGKGNTSPFVPDTGRFAQSLALSPDGALAAVTVLNSTATYETWVADATRATLRRTIAPPKADASGAIWSPDGRSLAYFREGMDGQDGVYVQRVDGVGDARRVLPLPTGEFVWATSWLPDSSALILTRNVAQNRDLVMASMADGGAGLRTLRATPHNEENGVVSSDGRLLAFASNETGQTEIYVATFVNGTLGTPVPVSRGASNRARWAPGTRRLYFCDLANVLTAVDVTGDSVLSASPPRPVQDLAKFRIPTTTWDVFADGRIIGIQRSDTEDALPSINLVFNWTDEVKRRLGR